MNPGEESESLACDPHSPRLLVRPTGPASTRSVNSVVGRGVFVSIGPIVGHRPTGSNCSLAGPVYAVRMLKARGLTDSKSDRLCRTTTRAIV